jgi:hypothetical protein
MSGRIRSLKPEWLDDEPLMACSDAARVLSAALLLLADDYGNGRASDLYLGSKVFPGKRLEKIKSALKELTSIRYLQTYEVDNQRYFSIRNFRKHQKIDKVGKPRVPAPLEKKFDECSSKPRDILDSLLKTRATDLEGSREQGTGSGVDPVPINERPIASETHTLTLTKKYLEKTGRFGGRLTLKETGDMQEFVESAGEAAERALDSFLADQRDHYRDRRWPLDALLRDLGQHLTAAGPKKKKTWYNPITDEHIEIKGDDS